MNRRRIGESSVWYHGGLRSSLSPARCTSPLEARVEAPGPAVPVAHTKLCRAARPRPPPGCAYALRYLAHAHYSIHVNHPPVAVGLHLSPSTMLATVLTAAAFSTLAMPVPNRAPGFPITGGASLVVHLSTLSWASNLS